MEKEYKTPVYVRKAINKYQEKKKEDEEYSSKLREYNKLYMRNYRIQKKSEKNNIQKICV